MFESLQGALDTAATGRGVPANDVAGARRHGDMLPLRLAYERWKAERLDNLESWVASGATIVGITSTGMAPARCWNP